MRTSENTPSRNCPKSLGGAHCVAVRETETVLFGPCRAPYTAKYGVGALLVTLFGQFPYGVLGSSVPGFEGWHHACGGKGSPLVLLAGRRREGKGSDDTTLPFDDLLPPRVRYYVGGVGAASGWRPARHRGAGVDLGPGHSGTPRSSPHRRARRGEGARGATSALARRLAVVSSGHLRACYLLTRGSRDLCDAWW